MTKKVLSYGAVGLLAAVLLGGTAYALLTPSEAQAQGGPTGGPGRSGENREIWQDGEGLGDGFSAYGQGRGRGRGRGNATVQGESLNQGAYGRGQTGQNQELSAEEIQGILYMREEEKLARDVYLTLHEQWELPVFQNIANSEQAHMNAVKTLIDRYGLDDPMDGNDVGEFTNPTLQSLYDDLVATGSESLTDALLVGAAIEEIDILDLEEYLSQTDARDIQRVYENLLRGSRNHLRSFVATLEQQAGEVYEPLYLEQQAFDGIVNTPMEGGGHGQGQGRGGAGMAESGAYGQGQGQGRSGAGQAESGAYGQGQGQGRGGAGQMESGSFASGYGQGGGRGNSSGAEASGRGAGERGQAGGMASTEGMAPIDWETLTGKVILVDHEVTIETADGEVVVGMGQSAFWEHFALDVGDQITVTDFSEDGEFKAGTVENLTTGESLTLRDETGRPVWSGQGRLKNR